jgi:hypothetical protein
MATPFINNVIANKIAPAAAALAWKAGSGRETQFSQS